MGAGASRQVAAASSRSVARDRLKVILTHERSAAEAATPADLAALQAEMLAVVKRHFRGRVADDKVVMAVTRSDDAMTEVLELRADLEPAGSKEARGFSAPPAKTPKARAKAKKARK